MKTIFISAAFFFAAVTSVYSQNDLPKKSTPSSLAKGSLQLGVNGMGGIGNSINGKSSAYLVSPWAGYLLQDKLVTGLSVTFSSDKYTSKDTSVTPDKDQTNVSPEVFARYYLMSGKLKPFAELGAGFNFLNADGEKKNGAYLSPSIGLSYWVVKRVSLEANYKLKLQSKTMRQVDPASDLKLRFGFSLLIN